MEQFVGRNKMDKIFPCGLCKSDNTYTRWDVGWDIDIDGEERQHEQVCRDCGARMIWGEHTKHGEQLGSWDKY